MLRGKHADPPDLQRLTMVRLEVIANVLATDSLQTAIKQRGEGLESPFTKECCTFPWFVSWCWPISCHDLSSVWQRPCNSVPQWKPAGRPPGHCKSGLLLERRILIIKSPPGYRCSTWSQVHTCKQYCAWRHQRSWAFTCLCCSVMFWQYILSIMSLLMMLGTLG